MVIPSSVLAVVDEAFDGGKPAHRAYDVPKLFLMVNYWFYCENGLFQ